MKKLLGAFVLCLAVSTAHADNLGTANSFNAFIFNNATAPGGHADGAVAVGGSWTNMAYNTVLGGPAGTVGATNNIGLYIGGDLSLTADAHVNNSADAYISGAITNPSHLGLNGGTLHNTAGATGPTVFSDQLAYSTAQSSYLAGLSGLAIDMSDNNNWKIDDGLEAGSLKVFNVNGSQLGSNVTLGINNFQANDTIVINVAGDAANFGVTLNGNYNRVLWNFSNANTLNINGRALHGSILAPNATVNQSQNIDGTLIANNWNVSNSVEIHHGNTITFDGNIPNRPPTVPEPSSLALLVSVIPVGAVVRRKRR